MAPAAWERGMPSPWAMPMKATPTVPAVPYDVPVTTEMMLHTKQAVTRYRDGEMILRP